MSQKKIFSAGERNKYYERNKDKLIGSDDDPIIEGIAQLALYFIKKGTADDIVSVMILEKNVESAFPDNPYQGS
jgi:hypothetical protein